MTAREGKALLDHGRAIARRYARRVGGEAAEELRAEAVLRALGSPPPDGRMEPWLERIYRNLLVDRWRRRRAATIALADSLPACGQGTPEEALLCRERRRVVRDNLSRLSRDARRALLSRFWGELDDEVAATRFGVAPVTMRTRIHRALARLRGRLADLRAFCPPVLGKLGAQAVTVGLAPVMVAALVVVGASFPPPEPGPHAPAALVAERPLVQPRAPAAWQVVSTPAAPRETARTPRKRATTARVPPPAPAVLDLRPDEPIVGEILYPEGIDVFADPERPAAPCLVESPHSLLPQIDKMVEELL
jgi:RNA polymerase sigma-70 factor (ECF subfamily)